MSSIDQQNLSLISYPTSSSINRLYKRNFGSLSLCQVPYGGRQRQMINSAAGLPESGGIYSLSQQNAIFDPAQPTKPITAVIIFQTALLRANLKESTNQQLFKKLTAESLSRSLLVSSLHPPARYQETTAQQPAPTADQIQLNPAAVPVQPSYSICIT